MRSVCSDLRRPEMTEPVEFRWGRAFLHRVRGIWRSKHIGKVRPAGWAGADEVLPRFALARKADPLRADGEGVRHTTGVLLLLAAASLAAWCASPETVIHKRVSEVRLTLVATDQNDRPIEGLSPSDITVLEDGRPVPRFELRTAADLRLRVAIVVDLSDSTRKSWVTVRSALSKSLQDVMKPDDEVMVLAFNSRIELERWVKEPGDLETLLSDSGAGGLTALYDAIYQTCGRSLFATDGEPHRSALILFSDGEDDLSIHGLGDTIARAESAGVAIYTVATHNPKKRTAGDVVLRNLAAATGGKDFVVKDSEQLGKALSEIKGELRSSYLLYYRASEQPGVRAFRRVHVIPTQSGARVRSREGYYTAP
jgi:VWFA-related protein